LKYLISLASLLGLIVLLLAACEPGSGGGEPAVVGVTISGTIVGYYYNITGNVTVTVTQAPTSLSVQVTLVDGGSGLQDGTYSIPDVPEGTYNVVIVFESDNSDVYATPAYSINGGAPVPRDSYDITGSGPYYTHTITFNGVPVNGDETINIDLGDTG